MNKTRLLRWGAGFLIVVVSLVPILFFKGVHHLRDLGYLGFFIADYLGFGAYLLPFLVKRLDPVLLVVISVAGVSLHDLLIVYFGKLTSEGELKSKTHQVVAQFISRYGATGIFLISLFPIGFLHTAVAAVAGHYGYSVKKFLIASVPAKLVRYIFFVWASIYLVDKFNFFGL
ncbi:hypothetical protein HY045_00235 [Candidatus Woesebacteria bacterium]|nr:hypothetical protein [Candidatus Woesebacteria bacterium]